jgi:tRNA nucleotidyltransferase (CCA-adding enzyme)
MFNFTMNNNAVSLCRELQKRGFQSYLVGGCIRDLLMQQTPHDWDIATSATPDEVISIFQKTYETGLKHGTVSIPVNDELFEVTTFRTEGTYSDGRHPDKVSFVSSITEDLARRDFTINALAYDPINNVLIDPFDGKQDLQNKLIKAVGSPLDRFSEDGLRIMRAARFASRLQFDIEEKTQLSMKSAAEMLRKISQERIRDELIKTLKTEKPSIGLELLYQSGIFNIICPAIKAEREKFAPLFTNLDIKSGEMRATMETKLAYLMPRNKAGEIMRAMKFSNQEIERVSFIHAIFDTFLTHHDHFQEHLGYPARLFLGSIKNQSPDPYHQSLEQIHCYLFMFNPEYKKEVSAILQQPVLAKKEMPLKGGDLMQLGISPGPMIKTVLNAAYDYTLRFPERNDREELIRYAAEFITELQNEPI